LRVVGGILPLRKSSVKSRTDTKTHKTSNENTQSDEHITKILVGKIHFTTS